MEKESIGPSISFALHIFYITEISQQTGSDFNMGITYLEKKHGTQNPTRVTYR